MRFGSFQKSTIPKIFALPVAVEGEFSQETLGAFASQACPHCGPQLTGHCTVVLPGERNLQPCLESPALKGSLRLREVLSLS